MFKYVIFFHLFNVIPSIYGEKQGRILTTELSIFPKNVELVEQFLKYYKFDKPVMLLVDSIKETQIEALNFLQNLEATEPLFNRINFMLIKFNSSGVSSVLETTYNNRTRFIDLLKNQNADTPSPFLGISQPTNKTVAFFAVLNAVYLLPRKGIMLIFINRGLSDEELAQHALNEVLKKEIKVLVMWGSQLNHRREEILLQQLANYSEGGFILNTVGARAQEFYQKFLNGDVETSMSSVIFKRNLMGEHFFKFPVDITMTDIHIRIMPNITQGILTTPTGEQLSILDSEEIADYTNGSFLYLDPIANVYEVHINTTLRRNIGIWQLYVNNENIMYSLKIFTNTKLKTEASITFNNNDTDTGRYDDKLITLKLKGKFTSIENITFVNKYGQSILNNSIIMQHNKGELVSLEQIESVTNQLNDTFNVRVGIIPQEPFYVTIDGKDTKGNNFKRQSYVKPIIENSLNTKPILRVEVSSSSQLITQGGTRPQIYFEVTNDGDSAFLVQFYCSDKESILLSMSPYYQYINPRETASVRLTLTTKPGKYTDVITFTARGPIQVTKTVNVEVGSTLNTDNTYPIIDYHFTSDCSNVLLRECQEGSWSVEVTAQDRESGLLSLTSNPTGIYVDEYTVGTREKVSGIYSESCCYPDLQIVAIDRNQNRKVYEINGYRAPLSPTAIAAIVLGILILLAIIIVVVVLVRKFFCKQKQSFDLPTYRGPNSRERNR